MGTRRLGSYLALSNRRESANGEIPFREVVWYRAYEHSAIPADILSQIIPWDRPLVDLVGFVSFLAPCPTVLEAGGVPPAMLHFGKVFQFVPGEHGLFRRLFDANDFAADLAWLDLDVVGLWCIGVLERLR